MTNQAAHRKACITFIARFELAQLAAADYKSTSKAHYARIVAELGELAQDASEAEAEAYWDREDEIDEREGYPVIAALDERTAARTKAVDALVALVEANPLATPELVAEYKRRDAFAIATRHWDLVERFAAKLAG